MEAMSGHTDDMYHSREWSRTNDSASYLWCGRAASSLDIVDVYHYVDVYMFLCSCVFVHGYAYVLFMFMRVFMLRCPFMFVKNVYVCLFS